MRRVTFLFVMVLLVPFGLWAESGVVTYVFDGDTIKVGEERVRLIGVDAPEVDHRRYGKKGECYGPEAKAYLEKRLLGKKVRLVQDSLGQRRDKYHRLLAYVYRNGRLINEELIKEGYAQLIWDFPFTKRKAFLAAQNQAIAKRTGYWKRCMPTP